MADLTILSHQPSTLSSHITVNTSRPVFSSPQSLPASPSSPPSNVIHTNNGLLSPPHNTFRAAPSTRRSKKPRRKAQSESDETATETSDEEELEIRITSYTNSFRPFSYPSTPKLVTVSTTSQGNLPRPPPPLCKSWSTVLALH